jgi:dihydroorotate dehydrogenase (NAD+) catalytic subunit
MVLDPDLRVKIKDLILPNPVLTASGTFGYGREFEDFINLHKLGAIVVKGISLNPRPGNPPPRIVETASGMLNAIGLENVGIEKFISEKLPYLNNMNCRVIVNILGDSVEEYCQLAEQLDNVDGIKAIELNISCPNVKKGGAAFGTNSKMANEVVTSVRKKTTLPVLVKLSPNVTDIVEMAKAVEEGGADAISLINTLIGMAIDIKTQKPILANTIGGLSGPAIKPVALRMVWQVAEAVNIPIIGIGGISTWQDAVEFILAGATAIQVGTANFFNPKVTEEIIAGIQNYMMENNYEKLNNLIGAARK